MSSDDPYLQELYQSLHDSPMQQKIRKIRPWPVGCVFIQRPGWGEDEIRAQFRHMRELGFTSLKQCQVCRGTSAREVMHMALDEGIIPWWYGEGGWEEPTPELLKELGIDPDTPIEQLRENEAWLERQLKVMHDRVDASTTEDGVLKRGKPAGEAPARKRGPDWVPSVQPRFRYEIDDEEKPLFLSWLKKLYGDIETLNKAWNMDHCMISPPKGLPQCGGRLIGWESWEHLESELQEAANGSQEYRRARDVLRFKADNYLNWLRDRHEQSTDRELGVPIKGGGEMGLFLPFAARGTDMEGIAELMTEYGSFYPSFHLAWHFEEVDFETVRPYYMMSSLSADWFKGGWAATWESTGGPQQMTGQKAPFVPKVRDKTPGFTVDEGVMRQLMFSWIAGGYRGFGMWAWCMRTFGWEGGEYGLVDRNYRATDRAIIAGKIGQACRRLRDELWTGRKEPLVGVLQDWDMEAIWAAASLRGRDFFKNQPIRARIGASRALINGNVPWEHVTPKNLRKGLGGRYRCIMLPAALALGTELLELLYAYVEQGGRVVMDAPGGWYDDYGRVLGTDDGSPFEKLFGCRLADFQYSRDGNRPWSIDGRVVKGCTLDIQPTTAAVIEEFDHSRPDRLRPAIAENKLGKGTAVVLGCEASLMCTDPGHEAEEAWLRDVLVAGLELPYACEGALVYRLATDTADHYFLMNDKPGTVTVNLDTRRYEYSAVEDPVEQQALEPGAPIEIPDCSARWVRMQKR